MSEKFNGFGLGFYLILALSLPREDKIDSLWEPRLLGVCIRFAKRFDLDVGLTRAAFLTALFASGGTVILVYFILYIVLPKTNEI